jgi:gliding motility-associated-like protein
MKKHISILFFLFFLQFIYAQYITVDDQRTAQDLIENVLLNNTGCASVSNFTVSGGNFSSGNNSYGYFDATGTAFPFQEGLILSTGNINDAPGPNAGVISGSVTGWNGLDAASANTLGENNTFNATSIEFDFVPLVDHMSFEYIFASEEYELGFMCNFSDVFGFLLKKASEPDSAYVNIALIPGTSIPVKVTTVHPQGDTCPPENEQFFDAINGFNAPIDFQGQTVTLIAESDVEPNVTYHIKLIIADDGDPVYDSAVFLNAGSFDIGTDLGDDRLIVTNNAACNNEEILLDAGTAASYQWYKDGVILSGETNQILIIDSSFGDGNYSVTLDLGSGCISHGSIEIEFASPLVVYDANVSECRDAQTNTAIFDLTDVGIVNVVTGNNSNFIIDSYYETMVDYNSDPQIPISSPDAFESAIHQPVYAKVIDVNSDCFEVVTINLDILEPPILSPDEEVFYCTDTFPATIVLNSGNLDTNNLANYIYNWSNGETSESIMINEIGDYTVTVTNLDNCSKSRTIKVLESTSPIVQNVFVADTRYPDRVSIEVIVEGQGDYIYALDIDPVDVNNDLLYQEENTFNNVLYGEHIITIKDINGCGIVQKDILLLEYPKFITPNGDGRYDTWNIDNINTNERFKTVSDILIFDRYGKIMARIKPNGVGWDGKYNGKIVPPDDYWFVVSLRNYKGELIEKKGHFSVN